MALASCQGFGWKGWSSRWWERTPEFEGRLQGYRRKQLPPDRSPIGRVGNWRGGPVGHRAWLYPGFPLSGSFSRVRGSVSSSRPSHAACGISRTTRSCTLRDKIYESRKQRFLGAQAVALRRFETPPTAFRGLVVSNLRARRRSRPLIEFTIQRRPSVRLLLGVRCPDRQKPKPGLTRRAFGRSSALSRMSGGAKTLMRSSR